ncbi:MAG: HDIG domain-containing protein, partial [Rectinemataceae bacterium]|nr:HDIG domain-containing protein [Rectinemataceae bacterium]
MNQSERQVKKNADNRTHSGNRQTYRGPAFLVLGMALFIFSIALVIFLGPRAFSGNKSISGIETGKISERDVIGERELILVDKKATELRMDAEERLVLPIFTLDPSKTETVITRFRDFSDIASGLATRGLPQDTLFLTVQKDFPGFLEKNEVLELFRSPNLPQILISADAVLRKIMDRGIAAIPGQGLERYNPDYLELHRLVEGRTVTEELPISRLVTMKSLYSVIDDEMSSRYVSRVLSGLVGDLVAAFALENVFFDQDRSSEARERARKEIEPVLIRISKGERIIRKGTIVTESDFAKLQAIRNAVIRQDWNLVASQIGLMVICIALAVFFFGKGGMSGTKAGGAEMRLLATASYLFFLTSLVLSRFFAINPVMAVSQYLPTAFLSMVVAVLAGPRTAVLYSIILALLSAAGAGINGPLILMVCLSGIAGAFVARSAGSRIDLVRAALVQALIQAGLGVLLSSGMGILARDLLTIGLIHAGNGFLCGVLSVALLPVLEQSLNVPTRFRLLELSDLNTPAMKRMQSVAPGTYSHSITVAHLAETACRAIGADPLLARVGAYYHDIGKMEQPEYFIENQSGYNKHEEINPRLSATVIRSHVKIGAEKARGLGLPQAVVDIIAQHHGNGV